MAGLRTAIILLLTAVCMIGVTECDFTDIDLDAKADQKGKDREHRCPRMKLDHGRVRLRTRGRFAYFRCNEGHTLLGAKYAFCEKGKWSSTPMCAAASCVRPVSRGRLMIFDSVPSSHIIFQCPDGFMLKGSESLICQNGRWNGTVPSCVSTSSLVDTVCNFEKDLCGWMQDVQDDFDWVTGSGPTSTKYTGPSHDHTYGQSLQGRYLYLEAMDELYSKSLVARLISPTFKSQISKTSCFQFWYHAFGVTIGQLNVYVRPLGQAPKEKEAPLFSTSGNQGDKWHLANITLPEIDTAFKIIIEGSMGEGFFGDLAIDDLQLYKCKEDSNLIDDLLMVDANYETEIENPDTEPDVQTMVPVTTQSLDSDFQLTESPIRDKWKPVKKKPRKPLTAKKENEILREQSVAPLLGTNENEAPSWRTAYISGDGDQNGRWRSLKKMKHAVLEPQLKYQVSRYENTKSRNTKVLAAPGSRYFAVRRIGFQLSGFQS